jgi:hypothetical protein
LQNHPTVTRLGLSGTHVTDGGLESLSSLKKLVGLFLGKTEVTDNGLKHLYGLTNLTRLDLRETNVSDEGVMAIQKSLPGCAVISGSF